MPLIWSKDGDQTIAEPYPSCDFETLWAYQKRNKSFWWFWVSGNKVDLITSLPLKKAPSCIGADRGSGLWSFTPPPPSPKVYRTPLICLPPTEVSLPSGLLFPLDVAPPLTCFPPPSLEHGGSEVLGLCGKSLVLKSSEIGVLYLKRTWTLSYVSGGGLCILAFLQGDTTKHRSFLSQAKCQSTNLSGQFWNLSLLALPKSPVLILNVHLGQFGTEIKSSRVVQVGLM